MLLRATSILLSSLAQASGGFYRASGGRWVFFLIFVELSLAPPPSEGCLRVGRGSRSALTLAALCFLQFDRLWKEMPVTAKGRLRYVDFLSRFSSEKAPTPPSSSDSTKAPRKGDVPATSEGGRAVGSSSPTRDPSKTGAKQRSHPCVSSPPLGFTSLCRARRPSGGSPVFPGVWVPGEGPRGARGGVSGQQQAWGRKWEGRGE